jgi:CheY-like chemotaxis protein
MNGVMGMIELLLNTELAPSQRKYAETVRRSGRALLAVIGDILDYSKIEAGRVKLDPIPFDLEVAVEDVVELLTPLADEKRLSLVMRYAPDAPRRFVGDVGRIRQIITNLVGNALKFTDEGHVFINIDCDKRTDDSARMRVGITDTGIGIPEQKLADIFAKFEQAGQSRTKRQAGTGLGLAISKEFVILMGGKIGVQSKDGEGATFYFVIPLPLDKQTETEPATTAADLEGLRVLIMSDSNVHRPVLQEQFSMWGVRCEACDSIEQTVKELRKACMADSPYQMLFVEALDPLRVEQVARAVKQDYLVRETILVLLTSMGQRGDARRMAGLGYAAYLSRPMRNSELREALGALWHARATGNALGLVTRHTVAESREAPETLRVGKQLIRLKVLVVEDNVVNQQVAYEILNSLGCTAHIAEDGKHALSMHAAGGYDVIFMDCQMPVMDGFEATGELRRIEGDAKHTPIIAMTAHAMMGDRERCLAAGMDDYISKPIDPDGVLNVLKRCLGLNAKSATVKPATEPVTAPEEEPPVPAVDIKQALWVTGGRVDMLRRLLDVFQSSIPERIAELRKAVEVRNAEEVRRLAHSIKGASASVGATRLNKVSLELEQLARQEKMDEAAAVFEVLASAFEDLKRALHELDWDIIARQQAEEAVS